MAALPLACDAHRLSNIVEEVFWLVHVWLLLTDDVTADGSRTNVESITSALIQYISTQHTTERKVLQNDCSTVMGQHRVSAAGRLEPATDCRGSSDKYAKPLLT